MKKILTILFIFLSTLLSAQTVTTKVVKIANDSTQFGSGIPPQVLIINSSDYKVYESLTGLAPTLSIKTCTHSQLLQIGLTNAQTSQILTNQLQINTINDTLIELRKDINANKDSIYVLRKDLNGLMVSDTAYATKVALKDSVSVLKGILSTKMNLSDTAAMLAYYRNQLAKKLNISDTAAMLLYYRNALSRKLNITDTAQMLAWYKAQLGLKLNISDTANMLLPYHGKLNISDTAAMLNPYLLSKDTLFLYNEINKKLNISDTANMLLYYRNKLVGMMHFSDTTAMLVPYIQRSDTSGMLVPYAKNIRLNDSLAKHLTLININSSNIAINTSNISSNLSKINTNISNIGANADSIAAHRTAINTNATNIASNSNAINTNGSDISTNSNNISSNLTKINTNISNITKNTDSISAHNSRILTNQTNIATNASNITTNSNNISNNTASINTNSGNITKNSDSIAAHRKAIDKNTDSISAHNTRILANLSGINTNADSIAAHRTDINSNSSNIASNLSSINTNTSNISSNLNKINTNTSNISTNSGNISLNTDSITAHRKAINKNIDSLVSHNSRISANQTNIATNASGISTNSSNISSNLAKINTNTANISANTDSLSVHNSKIIANQQDISTNTSNISSNLTKINSNTSNISTNSNNIAKNVDSLSSHLTLIKTNKSNIASNLTSINTNAGNISTNSANITTNSNSITTNANNISANTASINTNSGNITKNSDTLSVHRTAINTNASNIASNSNAIGTKVPKTTTITINGLAQDLSTNRSWTIDSVSHFPVYHNNIATSYIPVVTKDATNPTYAGVRLGKYINFMDNMPDGAPTTEFNTRILSSNGELYFAHNNVATNYLMYNASNLDSLKTDIGWNTKQDNITLTTTGSSGAATFSGNTLNIPNYTLSGLGYTIPTLDQVTTAGNSTADSITIGAVTPTNLSTGYIPYKSSGSLVNSPIYTDGTNVGIGTTSPGTALEIKYATPSPTASTITSAQLRNIGLYIRDSSLANVAGKITSGIAFGYETESNTGVFGVDEGSGGAAGLGFVTGDNAAIAEAMRIDHDGNVGIGTTSPRAKLEVKGIYSTYLTGNDIQFTRAGASYISSTNASGALNLGAGGNNNDLTIQANHNVIINNGNVGIGTTSPEAKLDVAGSGSFTGNLKTSDTLSAKTGSFSGNVTAASINPTNLSLGQVPVKYPDSLAASNILSDGTHVGIGYILSDYLFYVNGTAGFSGNVTTSDTISAAVGSFSGKINSNDAIWAANGVSTNGTMSATDFILSSDSTLKHEIKPLNVNVSNIPLVQFKFKADTTNRERYGVIAQDLEKVAPAMVYKGLDGKLKVSYIEFLIARLSNDESKIDSLQVKIKKQQIILNDLLKRVQRLENEK